MKLQRQQLRQEQCDYIVNCVALTGPFFFKNWMIQTG